MRLRSNPFGFATRHPDEGVSPIPGDEQSAGRFAHLPSSASQAKRSAAELGTQPIDRAE
jgi:hypothetical protein